MRANVRVDVSEAIAACHEMHKSLSPKMFNECMKIALKDAGSREVKKQVKEHIPQVYHASKTYVGRKVGKARMKGDLCCEVPIRSERGILGGMFPASGGGYSAGRVSTKGTPKKKLKHNRAIQAKILKARVSKIPAALPNQGGNPPFRLPSGIVLTRSADRHLVRVVGRSVPQMVDRRFEERLEEPISRYIIKRMDQVIRAKTDGTWGKRG